MNRRKALKNLGATIGITTLSPTILSIFESCQKNNSNKLLSFNNEQFEFISSIIDIIIPRTDTPGAIDLNLNKFIDVYIEEVLYKKEKENFQIKIKNSLKVISALIILFFIYMFYLN